MEDGRIQFGVDSSASQETTTPNQQLTSADAMIDELDTETVERRKNIVNSFVLVSVIGDPRPSVGKALDILWNSGVRTIGDIRGKRLCELFGEHSLTVAQQKHFASTLHKFGVFLD